MIITYLIVADIPKFNFIWSDFWYEGKSYEFNFSKFWTFCRTKFECSETDMEVLWHVRQETTSAVMDTKISCQKKDMLFINYEAPNGKKLNNRLFNGDNGIGTKTCGALYVA